MGRRHPGNTEKLVMGTFRAIASQTACCKGSGPRMGTKLNGKENEGCEAGGA